MSAKCPKTQYERTELTNVIERTTKIYRLAKSNNALIINNLQYAPQKNEQIVTLTLSFSDNTAESPVKR